MKKKEKSLHIVRFMGGFANQLFQYAFYCRLKEEYGIQVFADLSHYDLNQDHGGFKLDRFFDIQSISEKPDKCIVVTEKNYTKESYKDNKIYLYIGFWQSAFYFPKDMSFLESMLRMIELKDTDTKLLERIRRENSVSIHVRRGDYVDNAMHGNISTKAYFQNAVAYVQSQLLDATYYVFSDDINWCKEELDFDRAKVCYVEGNESYVDLLLMSNCKHNIISNSSFSWWAKTLNKNETKIITVPPRWFNDAINVEPLQVDEAVTISNIPYIGSSRKIRRIYCIWVTDERLLERCLVSILNQYDDESEILITGRLSKSTELYVSQCEKLSGVNIRREKIIKKRNVFDKTVKMYDKDVIYIESDEYFEEGFIEKYRKYI